MSGADRPRGPELGLVRLLRGLGLLLFVAALLYVLAPVVGPWAEAFRPLPWLAASAAKVSLLGALCLYAAADLHRRRSLVRLIAFAHLFSVGAMLVILLFGDTGGTLPGTGLAVTTALWIAIAMDGLILIVLWSLLRIAETSEPEPGIYALDDYEPVTAGEGNLRAFATVFGLLCIASALVGVWMTARGTWPELLTSHPWVTNADTLAFAIGLVCFHAVAEIRPRQALLGVVMHALGVGTLVALGYWALGLESGVTVRVGSHVLGVPDLLLLTAAVLGGSYVALFSLYQAAWRARYRLRYLEPMEFRTLLGLSDVIIDGEDEALDALEVAKKVDATIFQIGAERRWIYRLILFIVYLHPMLYLRAPLPEMARETRLAHLLKHFYHEPRRGVLPKAIRDWVSGFIRAAKQLAYVGYYSQRPAWDRIGYIPFSERPPQPGESPREVSQATLDVWGVDHPRVASVDRIRTDVCIIGSGAAGAIIALELAKRSPGVRILVVERGRYVPPSRFSEDEVEMMANLYSDGLFQQTRDSRFTILQGSCVGGSTVVNNAVSFRPRQETLDIWEEEHGVDFGSELATSLDEVWTYMGVRRQEKRWLNPSGEPYLEAATATGGNVTDPLRRADIVEANIDDCLGSGYCNIGCAWGKKLSMLEKALPDAQAIGDVSILSDARVEYLYTESGKPPRIRTALVRLAAPGAPADSRGARFIEIEAETFVVSAGAIASPWLLMRSGIGRGLPVGERMSFNMGAPVTAEFPDTSEFRGGYRAYEGLQISHFGLPEWDRGWVHETWWNPPVAQSVSMPGWFGHHHDHMGNYRNLMGVGVLVGTAAHGKVRRALLGGADVDYEPDERDLRKLADGLKTTSEILFEAGATRVMFNTADLAGDPMTTRAQLDRLEELCLRGSSYMTLGTGHPQGGNALGPDPETSVVSTEDFRVHGYANLYVCDASVFPTSTTVNPQITVMGLAHLAASKVRL